jgi:hypothetical protein
MPNRGRGGARITGGCDVDHEAAAEKQSAL